MARTRSAANIAHAKARSGRSSVKRSEPPRRNRRRKDTTSSPPRRARTQRDPVKKNKKTKKAGPKKRSKGAKKNRQSTRSLNERRGRRRSFGVPRIFVLVFVMMGLGFGAVWGLDAWARLSRPDPGARVHTETAEAPEAREAPAAEAGLGLKQLWDKFVDRLLDRDLPVRRKKPILKAKRPAPTPVVAQPKPKPKPDARAEVAAPPPSEYQQEAKPLEVAQERKVKRETNRRARLDAILERVGVPER